MHRLVFLAACLVVAGCPEGEGAEAGETGDPGTSSTGASVTSNDAGSTSSSEGGSAAASTAEPAMCLDAVTLSDPQCDECVASSCCAEVELCFGTDGETSCAALHTCASACIDVDGEAEFEACLQDMCAPAQEDVDAWLAAVICTSECLAVSPGEEVTCEIMQ